MLPRRLLTRRLYSQITLSTARRGLALHIHNYSSCRSYTNSQSTRPLIKPPPKQLPSKSSSMPPSGNDRNTRNLSESEKRQVHENRMDRPPYALANPSKLFSTVYAGACFCEKVKIRISREKPLDAKYCHCKGCQVLHGAPFQWAAIFEKSDVHFYEGKDQLIYWNTPEQSTEYILPCKVYCNQCRAPIMDEGRNMLLLFPTLIQFKDVQSKLNFKPSCHIFYSRRAIDVPDGIPKWEQHKDESKLIPENLPPHNEPTWENEVGKP